MRALLSGQADLALVFDGDSAFTVTSERPDQRSPVDPTGLTRIFGPVTDLEELVDATNDEIVRTLERSWEKDRAYRLMLILLDGGGDVGARAMAAECLAEMLSRNEVVEYVSNFLFACPLPEEADLAGAEAFARRASTGTVLTDYLRELRGRQLQIRQRWNAWVGLEPELFGDITAKEQFKSIAVRLGMFRLFVCASSDARAHSSALLHCQTRIDEKLRRLPERSRMNAREVLAQWTRHFRPQPTGQRIEPPKPDPDENDLDALETSEPRPSKVHGRADVALARVDRMKKWIVRDLESGNIGNVRALVDELVRDQMLSGKPEHVAKSLCDLGKRAEELSYPELFLELCERAVAVCPRDGWALAQFGDALRAFGRYEDALSVFATAEAMGEEEVARTGRAETLRSLGRFEEALVAYDGAVRDFPRNAVARNGQAETLRSLGRFEEALAEYAAAARDFPRNAFARNGRAETFRSLGRFEEALAEYAAAVRDFPRNAVARNGRAETLRSLGRFEEALAEYAAAVRDFPRDAFARNGQAETLRSLGRFEEALTEYETTMRDFPQNAVARNGLVSTLVSCERYARALALLPSSDPRTADDWVALHIRAMIALREGRMDEAVKILERGVRECRWARQNAYFRLALATVQLRNEKYAEAIATIGEATEPVAQALRYHAAAALHHFDEAQTWYGKLRLVREPGVVRVREAVRTTYVERTDEPPWTPEQFFLGEVDMLLSAYRSAA